VITWDFAREGNIFGKDSMRWKVSFILFFIFLSALITGCASSGVSRNAAAQVDTGSQGAQDFVESLSDGDVSDTYQNSNQTIKGGIVGGALGLMTGALASPIGILPGTAGGIILGAAYGSYIDASTTLRDKLINRAANVVVLGDQVLIVIPSERLFHDMTGTIKSSANSTLDVVADYIRRYTKISVKVAADTSCTLSPRVASSLSQQQANSVERYLALKGVNARLLFAVGYGSSKPVQRETDEWGDTDNNRIEITLEKLPV
jgi:outer membrane protein OmpA-like peptidoglycan-associated protein